MRIFNRSGQEIETAGLVNELGVPIANIGARGVSGLGALDVDLGEYAERFKGYTKVLRQYVIHVIQAPQVGSPGAGSKTLGPEKFVLKNISWSCDGEQQNPWQTNQDGSQSPNVNGWRPYIDKSIQGRCIEMEWADEFTKFMAGDRALICAMFGDSDGFLYLPKPFLLEGKQTLTVNTTRIRWPFPIGPIDDETWPDAFNVRIDFVLHGIMLLPPGHHESGGAPVAAE